MRTLPSSHPLVRFQFKNLPSSCMFLTLSPARHSPASHTHSSSGSSPSSQSSPIRKAQRRYRKTKEQRSALMAAYHSRAIWTREGISEVRRKTGLRESQVYKWRWDYTKKLDEERSETMNLLYCHESRPPLKLEDDFHSLQKSYKHGLEKVIHHNLYSPSSMLATPPAPTPIQLA